MILIRTRLVVGAVAVTLAACGSGDDATDAAPAAPIVATTSIWADITSAVLCGADVPALIPAGADPHTFEPSLQTRATMEAASTVIANGNTLEESLVDLLDTAFERGVNIVEMTPHVDVLQPADAGADHDDPDHDDPDHDDPDHDDEHDHGEGGDPHIWQDPARVAGAVDVIASAGAALDLDTCADEYAATLMDLDAEITAMLDEVPADERIMVTSHDALAYFADRYDLEIVGTVIPSTNTLAQTNAADLARLADTIDDRGVRSIFTEALASTADADALAERLGVRVVPLVTDALTGDPASDTYVEMMRSNASLIAEALTP